MLVEITPMRNSEWESSIKFAGKSADLNADICMSLEDLADMLKDMKSGMLSKEKYEKWQYQMLTYYSGISIERMNTEDNAILVKITPDDLFDN